MEADGVVRYSGCAVCLVCRPFFYVPIENDQAVTVKTARITHCPQLCDITNGAVDSSYATVNNCCMVCVLFLTPRETFYTYRATCFLKNDYPPLTREKRERHLQITLCNDPADTTHILRRNNMTENRNDKHVGPI